MTVWTGTQMPFRVRSQLAQAFGIADEKVRVIVPDMGSGYGGKHTGESAVEAARLAKAAGKPVKLNWTREEEFTWAYFRPGRGDRSVRGRSQRRHAHRLGVPQLSTRAARPSDRCMRFRTSESPSIRPTGRCGTGSYRGLAATANHFARECHMDDLAHAAGIDPLAIRLKNLKDARLRDRARGRRQKVRLGTAKQTDARARLRVGVRLGERELRGDVCRGLDRLADSGKVHVVRAVTAFECGAIVNPDHLDQPVRGSTS